MNCRFRILRAGLTVLAAITLTLPTHALAVCVGEGGHLAVELGPGVCSDLESFSVTQEGSAGWCASTKCSNCTDVPLGGPSLHVLGASSGEGSFSLSPSVAPDLDDVLARMHILAPSPAADGDLSRATPTRTPILRN